jgi:ketosteroid isomerase-like protein
MQMVAPDPAVLAGIQIAQVLPYRMAIKHFEHAPIEKKFPNIHIPQEADNLDRLREIDRDIWAPFSEAYSANDGEKYLALHTTDFIRATGGEWSAVKDLSGYSTSVRQNFTDPNKKVAIAFTFFERIAGESMASERGIYRYTAISANGEQQHYYGQFHVFLRKIGGTWKIAVDYDSDEDGSIGEADFAAGLAPGVFSREK